MTTHELARKLLEGADVLVVVRETPEREYESVDVVYTSDIPLKAAYDEGHYPAGTVILI